LHGILPSNRLQSNEFVFAGFQTRLNSGRLSNENLSIFYQKNTKIHRSQLIWKELLETR
jgi:hypothetical protein